MHIWLFPWDKFLGVSNFYSPWSLLPTSSYKEFLLFILPNTYLLISFKLFITWYFQREGREGQWDASYRGNGNSELMGSPSKIVASKWLYTSRFLILSSSFPIWGQRYVNRLSRSWRGTLFLSSSIRIYKNWFWDWIWIQCPQQCLH